MSTTLATHTVITRGGQQQAVRAGRIVAVTTPDGEWLSWPSEAPTTVMVATLTGFAVIPA